MQCQGDKRHAFQTSDAPNFPLKRKKLALTSYKFSNMYFILPKPEIFITFMSIFTRF